MLFCSEQFLWFLTAVFCVYWSLPWPKVRVWLLLVASVYFYASWSRWLALLVCFSAIVDYCLARGMDSVQSPRGRKLLVLVSVFGNLGLLIYFKYANFFLGSMEDALRAVGASVSMPVLQVILPIGISFYTFEAISYTVDVYRRRIPAERNLGHFLLFILFFPHLVAGPIVRPRDFLPQIRKRKHWNWARLQVGAQFFLMGMFKKLAIADRMAIYADPVFASPGEFSMASNWVAAIAYILQIYCDFSGYSDMAIGTAHFFGYKLSKNFDMPYLSSNLSELWGRWHISLSTWLRDYVFVPLGSYRGGMLKGYRNLILTMVAGGLWHGAAWTFVLFGLYHGVLLAGLRAFQSFYKHHPRIARVMNSTPVTVACVALTFFVFVLGGVLFRCQSLATAGVMFGRLFVPHEGFGLPLSLDSFVLGVAIVVMCHALAKSGIWRALEVRLPAPVIGCGYAIAMSLALLLAPLSGKAFLYFQF